MTSLNGLHLNDDLTEDFTELNETAGVLLGLLYNALLVEHAQYPGQLAGNESFVRFRAGYQVRLRLRAHNGVQASFS